MSQRRPRESPALPFGEPPARSVAARTSRGSTPASTSTSARRDPNDSVRLDTSRNFRAVWTFRPVARFPDPHRRILVAYRHLQEGLEDRAEAEQQLLTEFRQRLQPEADGGDAEFAIAVKEGRVKSVFPPFIGFNLSRFTALDLAIIVGFFDLADFLVRSEVPLSLSSEPSHTSGVAHPLTAAIFALNWVTHNADADALAKLNQLTVALIRRTSDAEFPTIPGLVHFSVGQGLRVPTRIHPLFFFDLFVAFMTGRAEKAVVLESLRRPCRPTARPLIHCTDVYNYPRDKLDNNTALSDWLILPTPDRDIDQAFLRHPEVVDYLVFLHRIYASRKASTADADAVQTSPYDFKVMMHLCRRMHDDSVFRRRVRLAISDKLPDSILANALCNGRPPLASATVVRAQTAGPDPVPTTHRPPLAHATPSTSDTADVVPSDAAEVIQGHAAPMIQDFFPFDGEEERIPSRFKGGVSLRHKTNTKIKTNATTRRRRRRTKNRR